MQKAVDMLTPAMCARAAKMNRVFRSANSSAWPLDRTFPPIPSAFSGRTIVSKVSNSYTVNSSSTSSPAHSLSEIEKCDILIVGAGAAGLVAALRAHHHGLNPLVIEKFSQIGGASAYSGGGLWIPNNHLSIEAGVPDSLPNALKYLETVVKDVGPYSSRERKMAFLETGPTMVSWLENIGFKWRHAAGYPDYYPDVPGGVIGRTIEGKVFDLKKLGDWEGLILSKSSRDVAIYCNEYQLLTLFRSTWKSLGTVVNAILGRTLGRKLFGQRPVTMGKNLVAQLMLLCKTRGIVIWRQSPLIDLLSENGKVMGVVVMRDGVEVKVLATNGVLLCAGGFAHNVKLRQAHTDGPIGDEWTSVPKGDNGDAVKAGEKVGAALAMMDDAWWGPTFKNPATGTRHFSLAERSLPHCIIVDSEGKRFMNEAQSYVDCGHAIFERNKKVSAIPAWMVFDSQHRNRYLLTVFPPGRTPESAFTSGFIFKSDGVSDLAEKIGVSSEGLKKTISHFNEMAGRGVDDDFGRGRTAYDQNFGDPTCKPNPNLGPLRKGPFFAMQVWPGDLGTKGGLVTDESARVVKESGEPIEGLYAAGNTTASVMGRTYPGAGATLGPGLTFAFIATDHMALRNREA